MKVVVAENLLLKQQLLVLTRSRKRAPNLSSFDRFFLGLWSTFLNPRRPLSSETNRRTLVADLPWPHEGQSVEH
jgi:hypothetical protein